MSDWQTNRPRQRSSVGPFRGRLAVERSGSARLVVVTLLFLAAILSSGAAFWWMRDSSAAIDDPALVEQVVRRDFILDVTESGEIESTGNTEVRCEVEATGSTGTAILRIVPEGTQVQKGDFLVELDSATLENAKVQQQIIVNTSEALMIQARSEYETADIAKIEYVDGTFKQEKEIIESEIFVAEENLRRAKEFVEHSKRLAAKGYVTPLQLEADKFAVEKSKKELDAARTKLDVIQRFTRAKMLKQLESDIVTARARWESEKSSYGLEVSKLSDIQDQIAKCTIVAPAEGQVTYAHKSDWRGNNDVVIEEGAFVRERQVIIRLPDPSRMQVKIEINESMVDQVKEGMLASIRPVGRDEVVLPGTVTHVNEYSEPTSRWEGNVKNYAAFARIDQSDTMLRTGMSAEVTVHCREIPDVLQVPVQAVYAHGPDLTYCFVRQGDTWQEREVKLGPTNDSFVIIEEGLAEGESVSLDPRRHLDDADLPELSADALQLAVRKGPRYPHGAGKKQVAGASKSEASKGPDRAAALLKKLDKNHDGTLAKDEVPPKMVSRFAAVDGNQDGAIDTQELRKSLRTLAPNQPEGRPNQGARRGG
ncbi:MAG: HlyD family efflux transporter periplasmic adaptor subunit [Pirellulales bacterium]